MKQIKTIAIIIGLMLFINLNLSAFYVFNGGCKPFPNQCDERSGDGVSTQTLSIGQLIIDAAGHFLQSNSDYQLVLKKIELSKSSVIDSLDQTIQNMSAANNLYLEIWLTSLYLEYDPIVIEKLSEFDYNGYKLENKLNPVIFQQVEGFLKQGHVRKLFLKAFENSWKILYKLKRIKKSLEYGNKVDISKYWRLNQLYLEFALFGQYCSEVFMSI